MGVLLSLLLEILQYLTISGHTALLSFVTRPLGFMLTFWIYSRHQLLLQLLDTHFGLIVKAALIPYLVALAGVNGLLEFHIPNYEDFIDKLANTKYIPFYYHYFNSEVAAVKSVLAQFIMYSPLGGLVWGWSIKDRKQWSLARCNQIVIVLGFGLSSAMWLGRSYFSSHLFADPTNVLIGTISSFFGFVIASKGYQLLNKKNVPTPVPNGHIDGAIAGNNSAVFYRYVVPPACLFLLATLYSFYPYKLAILGFVVALLVGIWRKTERWLFIVPALLPVLDFKPVTGLFLFDELDFLLLSVLLVLSVRLKITSTQWWYDLNFMRWPLILLAISYGFSFVIRMLSDHALGQESHFNHYYDQWHSLRLLKGFIYPILFLPFIHHSLSQSPYLIKRFFYGCMTGITIVCLVVVAERWGFSSITDLDQHYRVAALFSSMHIGGQHLDAFLVMTAPCVAALLWWKNRYLKYCVGMLLSVLVSYSVFVTFSRWTLVSYLLVLFVMIVIWLIGHTSSRWRNSRWVMILLLFALLPLSFGVFTADTYLKERMQRFDQDTSIRVGHWFEAIRLGQAGIIDNALGMGLGGYPAAYLKTLAKEDRPGSFAIQEDKDKSFLRLEGGGKNLYLTQYISLPNVENLILSLSARGKGQEPLVVRFKICEKSIMYSRACHKLPVMLQQDSWDDYTLGVELKQTKLKHRGQGYSMSPRIPLFLSITTPPLGSQIDVTNIRLIDGEGNNLIENGGFEAGENYWFFSSDDHLIWHIKNIFAHLFVEQGWLGMIAFILLVFAVLNGAMQSRQNDSLVASILIGAIYGYCFVGLAGSLMDAYQLMIYFYLFVWVGIYSLNARSLIQSG